MGWTIGTCSMSTCNCLGAAKMASVSEKNGNSVSGGKPERGGLTGSGTGLEPKPIRVSVIDDDPMICQAMSLILNDYSHGRIEVVSTSTDGETCVRRAAEEKPDVVLMDIAMPGVDGIELLQRMKASAELRTIPVVMATAKGAEYDKIRGLDLGADYYLVKPFGVMELVSCVKAVLRRCQPEKAAHQLRSGGLVVDLDAHTVTVDGARVALTYKEFELLRLFLSHPGMAFTRDQLFQEIWGMDYCGETRTVDMHIRTLRQKLGPYGRRIETVRNVGYRMEATT